AHGARPAADRRGPRPRQGRVAGDARGRVGPRGDRRGRERKGGGRDVPLPGAGSGPHGREDARDGRPGGDEEDKGGPALGRRPYGDHPPGAEVPLGSRALRRRGLRPQGRLQGPVRERGAPGPLRRERPRPGVGHEVDLAHLRGDGARQGPALRPQREGARGALLYPLQPGDRDPEAYRRGQDQPRDRQRAAGEPLDGQDPRPAHHQEARRLRPHPGLGQGAGDGPALRRPKAL
ncbi:MAG: Two-component transcriptional response regulator, LuxR family, partial [uncultured Rubrobacteraceae bacterium]